MRQYNSVSYIMKLSLSTYLYPFVYYISNPYPQRKMLSDAFKICDGAKRRHVEKLVQKQEDGWLLQMWSAIIDLAYHVIV